MILSAMLSIEHPDTHGRQSCDGNLKGGLTAMEYPGTDKHMQASSAIRGFQLILFYSICARWCGAMKERTRRAQVGLAVAHAGVLHLHAHIVARLVPAGKGELHLVQSGQACNFS